MKQRTRLIVGVAAILAGVLVSFALEAFLLEPGAAAELKKVTFKIEGWVCYG